jgi:protease-4
MLVRKKHDLAKIITFAIKFNFLTLITMSSNTNQKFPWTKHFWLNVLSSTVGFIIGSVILTFIGIAIIVALMAGGSSSAPVERNSVLHIHLSGILNEQQRDNPLMAFMGGDEESLGLNELLRAISLAKDNDNIKAIWLEGGVMGADPASMQELRGALQDFKKSGKKIYAYADNYLQGTYYICSVADKVVLNPIGTVDWHGISSQIIFYKDLMAKLGVKMQVFKVGTYKSAVEPFTETQMTPANREQVTAFIGDIWQNFVSDVSKSRKLTPDNLNALADKFMAFAPSKEVKASKLVDELMYKDEFTDMLKKTLGVDEDDDLSLVKPSALCESKPQDVNARNQIAIYYAEGEIVDVAEAGMMAEAAIVGSKVNKDLQKLAADDNVKAVVLRINSGGGSAYASEQMWHNIKRLAKKKPVVVSMSGLAASGGYYMSVGADYIFAEPTTLTGSIGIFGMIPDASELLTNKLGLRYDVVKTNKLSDFGNVARPFNEEEGSRLQSYVENGYSLFLSRVAQARKKTTVQVDSIAQGRVWTGRQALKLGLVDKLGTLDDAVKYVASKAKMGDDYTVVDYPEVLPWYAELALSSAGEQAYAAKLRTTLGELYEPFVAIQGLKSGGSVFARMPYVIKIK